MKYISLIVLTVCFLAGCSAARVVRETKTGGEIALLGDREGAREKANQIMTNKCRGAGYEVDEEGEVVVGQQTEARSDQYSNNRSRSSWSRPSSTTTTSATSRDMTEWRILYHCKGAEAPAVAPAAPAADGAPQTGARHELILRF